MERSQIDYLVAAKINQMIDAGIIDSETASYADQYQIDEFALRFTNCINSDLTPQIPTIQTLFGVSSGKENFLAPNRSEIIDRMQKVYAVISKIFPPVKGLLLHGSRIHPQKSPRNTFENTSDIDFVPIISQPKKIDFGLLENSLTLFVAGYLSPLPLFRYIPLQCCGAVDIDTFISSLNINNPNFYLLNKRTRIWTRHPQAVYFLGSFKHNGNTYSQEDVNKLLVSSLSSEKYHQLRQQEIVRRVRP